MIRKFGIIFLVLHISLNVFSISCIDTNRLWTIQEYNFSLFPPPYRINNIWYVRIGSDTIVNSMYYNKLEKTSDTINFKWELLGLLRENNELEIFFKPKQGEEKLLFDFSLKLNDTLSVYNFACVNPVDLIAYKIDSINLNQKYFKRICLRNLYDDETTTWIESIGDSISGIFQNVIPCPGGIQWRLICYFQNDELIFNNPILVCTDLGNGYFRIDEESFRCKYPDFQTNIRPEYDCDIIISPNPTRDRIFIKIDALKSEIFSIRVFDLNGQLRFYKTFDRSTQIVELSLKNYRSGVYILKYISDDRNESFKIIKE